MIAVTRSIIIRINFHRLSVLTYVRGGLKLYVTSAPASRLRHSVTPRFYGARSVTVAVPLVPNFPTELTRLRLSIRCDYRFGRAEREPAARAALANPHDHLCGIRVPNFMLFGISLKLWPCTKNKNTDTHTHTSVFTTRRQRYASAVYAVVVFPSIRPSDVRLSHCLDNGMKVSTDNLCTMCLFTFLIK